MQTEKSEISHVDSEVPRRRSRISEQTKEKINFQFITNSTSLEGCFCQAREALDGGCRWIQLRMKEADTNLFVSTAKVLRVLCSRYDAVFILDDRVDLVIETNADGVHLGQKDMPIREARALLDKSGKEYIIGGTANTFEEIKKHYVDGADYVGCGPFRFTTTKKNLAPTLGLQGYMNILEAMNRDEIRLPLVAIGGIGFDDIGSLLDIGISGIALSGSIINAEHPTEEARRIQQEIIVKQKNIEL